MKAFRSAAAFRKWLAANHAKADEVVIRYFKKASGTTTISYAEALDEALCYGWIDGRADPCDDESWLQRFTPRRPRSGWSKRNITHAKRLIKEGRMRAAGLRQIEAAKKEGRWKAAYDSPSKSEVPRDFLLRLKKNKKTHDFFKALNRANVYAITYRLQTAKKSETRERRMALILEMMAKGQKFH